MNAAILLVYIIVFFQVHVYHAGLLLPLTIDALIATINHLKFSHRDPLCHFNDGMRDI